MESVYGNSHCNIAAVDSMDSRGGLFRNRDRSLLPVDTVMAASKTLGKKKYRIARQDFWDAELLTEPLYRRCWVFQERMLSRRILHFGRKQVFFECPSMSACEVFPAGMPGMLTESTKRETEWKRDLNEGAFTTDLSERQRLLLPLDRFWTVAVKAYTSCENLTNELDKLVAIAGVSKLLKLALKERYIAGLWATRLEEQLAWRVVDCKKADGSLSERQYKYRAPSWSWASIDGVIECGNRVQQDRTYRAKIVGDVALALFIKGEETAGVTDGLVEIQGQLGRGTFLRKDRSETEWTLESDSQDLREGYLRAFFDIDPGEHILAQTCYFLLLAYTQAPTSYALPGYSGHGILLHPSQGGGERMSRCGALRFTSLSDKAWQALEAVLLKNAERGISKEYNVGDGHTIEIV